MAHMRIGVSLFVYCVFGRIHRSLLQRIAEGVRLLSELFCRDIELFGGDMGLLCRDVGLSDKRASEMAEAVSLPLVSLSLASLHGSFTQI